MPWGLKRYYGTGGLHFITWSCFHRQPRLATPESRDLLLNVIELMRKRYRFAIVGYVAMPEHIHLLISEPQMGDPSIVVQAVKLGFVRRLNPCSLPIPTSAAESAAEMGHPHHPDPSPTNHFWQRRFYDFNVWSQRKEIEKLKYMHRNPVVRGLVHEPGEWKSSSYRSYAFGEAGLVRINDWSWWEEKIRERVS